VTLGWSSFQALVYERHFTSITESIEALDPMAAMATNHADVAIISAFPVNEKLPRIALASGLLRYVSHQVPNYYIKIEGTFDDYMNDRFGAKSRSALRRKQRKLEKEMGGQLVCRQYRTAEEFREFHPIACDLSERTYQAKLLAKGLPETAEFLQEGCELAARGKLRCYILFGGEQPLAYLYLPVVDGNAMIYDYVGYDPKHQKLSPGTVLQQMVLEDLFRDKDVAVFDFTVGEGQHKRGSATHCQQVAVVYFFKPTPKNIATVGAHLALERGSALTMQMLDRYNLRPRVKRMLRAFAVKS
jgi:CelD/BcsL family acetyltransferase involved in cellulose biosynthesis